MHKIYQLKHVFILANRMEILTTSGPKGTHENLYSTNSSNPDHYDNTEITSDVKTSLSKDEIPLPKRGYRNESIIVYDDATSNSKLNTSCKAMVHEPSEYITMKAKCLKETSFKNKESSSMKDNEYTSMKNKEHTSKQSNGKFKFSCNRKVKIPKGILKLLSLN